MAIRNKQYRVILLAGSNTPNTSIQATPATPSRCSLLIQNTGANPALFQISNPIRGDGSDILLAAGASFLFNQLAPDGSFNGPTESLNFGAALATTIAIMEGVAS